MSTQRKLSAIAGGSAAAVLMMWFAASHAQPAAPAAPAPAPPAAASATVTPDQADTVDADGKAAFEATCSTCHELELAAREGGHDAAGWQAKIEDMFSYGLSASDDDLALIKKYLTDKYPPGSKPAG